MGTGEFNAGGNPVMHHPGGSRNTPDRFMLLKPRLIGEKRRPDEPLGS